MKWLHSIFTSSQASRRELRYCTVSFTNMEGYVGIAERMSLEHLPIFMNRYFAGIGAAIHSRKGMIDKYIGDTVEAVWVPEDRGAQLACESALDQMHAMKEFYAWARNNGYPCPPIRIGINTGYMRIG